VFLNLIIILKYIDTNYFNNQTQERKGGIMRRTIATFIACASLCFVMGCATSFPIGTLYTELKLPVTVTANNGTATKVGTAECISVLALVAIGDASIEAAKKDGGITKVHHVDWEVENILGIIGKYKVTVYGE
jgi:TRL (tRNA-associated locus)-like protein